MTAVMWLFLCQFQEVLFMDQTFMKERKIIPLVLSMSLPMVLSMLVNSLYNIVDSYFVAKVSEDAMTALSLVYPVQIVVTAISVGFGVGINAMIAYFLGAGDEKSANNATTLGTLLSAVHGLLLTIVCIAFIPKFLGMFTGSENVIALGLEYAYIAFAFSMIITVGIALEKIYQAVGQMKVTMLGMTVGFVSNIILDPLLIFGVGPFPRMGMSGAALATGIGQTLTLICYIVIYILRPIPARISLRDMRRDTVLIGKLYSIGIPATLNMALPSLLISALNGILSTFGEAYVLVLGAYYKLQTFIYLPVNGIIQGIRPLVGYNYGAKENRRVKNIFMTALTMAFAIMLLGLILSWSVPAALIGIFTANPATITIGVHAMHIISLGFIVSAVSVTCCGALEGLGAGMPSLMISLLRYLIIMIPAALLLCRPFLSDGVWIAFPVTEVMTAVIAWAIYRRQTKHMFASSN